MTLALLAFGCGGAEEIARTRSPIEAACYDGAAASGWKCGEHLSIECGAPVTLYVPPAWAGACDALTVDPAVTWPPGDVAVSAYRPDQASPICTADLSIRDTTPPQVAARSVILWPPNHRWVEITPRDCVEVFDACDDGVRVEFTWVTSDEPADDDGDGRPERDVQLECDRVRLTAERFDSGNGRVYRVGVRATDASGLSTYSSCTVQVPNDVGGAAAIEDHPQYRIEGLGCFLYE